MMHVCSNRASEPSAPLDGLRVAQSPALAAKDRSRTPEHRLDREPALFQESKSHAFIGLRTLCLLFSQRAKTNPFAFNAVRTIL